MADDFQNLVSQAISKPTVSGGKPYFLGLHALVKFSSGLDSEGPSVFWLVDKGDKTLRPFESETALKNAFGEGYDTAMQHVVHLAHPKIDSSGDILDGALKGFSLLDADYAIREDGTAKEQEFSNHHLRNRYGKAVDVKAEEQAARTLEHVFKTMKERDSKEIPPSEIEKIKGDGRRVAFLLNAIAYGKYSGRSVRDHLLATYKRK